MDPACLFCKSSREDLDRFAVLLESVERHNRDALPFVLSVPRCDLPLFRNRFGAQRLEYVANEELTGSRAPRGWLGQQVVKMNFWRLSRAGAAMMVDSDFVFLRDFGPSDFLDDDGTPFLVVSLESSTYGAGAHTLIEVLQGVRTLPRLSRESLLEWTADSRPPLPPTLRQRLVGFRAPQVKDWFGREGPALHMMPGPVISYEVQRTFHEEYLAPNRLGYRFLLRGAPWEYVWLGEWLLARRPHDVRPIPPTFLSFTTDADVQHAKSLGITRADIARSFLGVAMAARHQSHSDY